MQNRFRPYNKSLLVNVFMNNEYKDICDKHIIPKYHNINVRGGDYACTPLINCCILKNVFTIRLLLKHPDIDVNIKNKDGDTALMWICYHGIISVAKLFLQRPEINLTIKNVNGETALSHIIEKESQELFNLLQSYGAK